MEEWLSLHSGMEEQGNLPSGMEEWGSLLITAFFLCSGECSPVDRKSPMREEQEKDAEGGTAETKQNGEWVDGWVALSCCQAFKFFAKN